MSAVWLNRLIKRDTGVDPGFRHGGHGLSHLVVGMSKYNHSKKVK